MRMKIPRFGLCGRGSRILVWGMIRCECHLGDSSQNYWPHYPERALSFFTQDGSFCFDGGQCIGFSRPVEGAEQATTRKTSKRGRVEHKGSHWSGQSKFPAGISLVGGNPEPTPQSAIVPDCAIDTTNILTCIIDLEN